MTLEGRIGHELEARHAPDDAALFRLLDIAAHHFSEGRYGWPSTDTCAAILAHWREGKPPVPDVFAAQT